jgi:hypothetical protein
MRRRDTPEGTREGGRTCEKRAGHVSSGWDMREGGGMCKKGQGVEGMRERVETRGMFLQYDKRIRSCKNYKSKSRG